MTYLPAYKQPDFKQSVPSGEGWQMLSPSPDNGKNGACRWRNKLTGETVTCPYVWYNAPASSYAKTLEFNATRSDESATRKESEGKPWSRHDAERFRRQARRLRAMALLCIRAGDIPAGHVDFMRLNDPTCPQELEDETILAIEQRRESAS